MELTFDPKKLVKVPINKVRPNSWNPKEQDTEEFSNVVKSIQKYGQDMPILVREKDGFEVLDGEQRYRAMKQLGFKEVWVYNKGEIADDEAKAVTLWWQVQVPFDEIRLAPIVLELSGVNIELPFSELEIKHFAELADFDFSQYDADFDSADYEKKSKLIKCPHCEKEFEFNG